MKNIYCHYTSSRIRRYTFSCIKKCLFSLYNFLHNDNKYCYYTASCIMRNTLSCIREIFVVVIYNNNKYFLLYYVYINIHILSYIIKNKCCYYILICKY